VGFNVSHDVDEMGRNVEVDINAYAGGGLAKPAVFRAEIEPRSVDHAGIMKKEWARTRTPLGTIGDVDKTQLDGLDRMYNEIYGSR
jgi:hypothetical protein